MPYARTIGALTARQVQILTLVGEGKSYKEVGRALFITENTVKSHMQRIGDRLGVRTRHRMVVAAWRAGVIS